jgi:hypothetical protein
MGKYSAMGDARCEKLEATASGNMPRWAQHDPVLFWRASDQYERANGTTYRELEIALPRELSPEGREALVRDWVAQELGDRYAYQWAIHVPLASDGGEQPHVHLMFSERQVDGIERDPEQYFKRYNPKNPERGGCRKGFFEVDAAPTLSARKASRIELLIAQRGRWEVMCNAALERAGHSERIDMRSHAKRGTGMEPEPKMTPQQWRDPEIRADVIDFRAARAERAAARAEVARLIPDVAAEIVSIEGARRKRAERELWLTMPLEDLRREVTQLRPLFDAMQLLDRRPEIKALTKRLQEAHEAEQQTALSLANTTAELTRWQQLHPAKAWLHRQGLWRDTSVRTLTEMLESQRSALDAGIAAKVAITDELQVERARLQPLAEDEHQEMVDRYTRISSVLQLRETEPSPGAALSVVDKAALWHAGQAKEAYDAYLKGMRAIEGVMTEVHRLSPEQATAHILQLSEVVQRHTDSALRHGAKSGDADWVNKFAEAARAQSQTLAKNGTHVLPEAASKVLAAMAKRISETTPAPSDEATARIRRPRRR